MFETSQARGYHPYPRQQRTLKLSLCRSWFRVLESTQLCCLLAYIESKGLYHDIDTRFRGEDDLPIFRPLKAIYRGRCNDRRYIQGCINGCRVSCHVDQERKEFLQQSVESKHSAVERSNKMGKMGTGNDRCCRITARTWWGKSRLQNVGKVKAVLIIGTWIVKLSMRRVLSNTFFFLWPLWNLLGISTHTHVFFWLRRTTHIVTMSENIHRSI